MAKITWYLIVNFIEEYSPLINYKVFGWIHPPTRTYKCNNDGPRKDSFAFWVRNEEGDFLYDKTRVLKDVLVIVSQIKAIKMGIDYYLYNNQAPLIVDMSSILAKQV